MADELTADGIATWNIEYRRVHQHDVGWPDTYLDVGLAVDHLRQLAPEHDLDLDRVVVVGHSAGGHLATWAAARSRLPDTSELYDPEPLPLQGLVNLVGPVDMTANIAHYEGLCEDAVITKLLGGTPDTVPERYRAVSANQLLPLGVPQVFVWGELEDFVPQPLIEEYVEAAEEAGDAVQLLIVPRADHFQVADVGGPAWPDVTAAILALLDRRLPAEGERP